MTCSLQKDSLSIVLGGYDGCDRTYALQDMRESTGRRLSVQGMLRLQDGSKGDIKVESLSVRNHK